MARIVANQGNGKCLSTSDLFTVAPMPLDICLVPPPPSGAPLPFINTADLGDATRVLRNVQVCERPAVIKTSIIPTSSGAPSNAIKGAASPPPANNRCYFNGGSGTVFAGSQKLVRHRDPTKQNAGNCSGGVKLDEALDLSKWGIEIDNNLTHAQKQAIVAALEELYTTPIGKELIDTMQNPAATNGHTTKITHTNGGSCADTRPSLTPPTSNSDGLARTNGTPGPGADAKVSFNPAEQVNPPCPPALVMGHELVHALTFTRGTADTRFVPGTTVREWESQAMGTNNNSNDRMTENALRSERGLPPRETYAGQPMPCTRDAAHTPPEGYRLGANGKGIVYAGG